MKKEAIEVIVKEGTRTVAIQQYLKRFRAIIDVFLLPGNGLRIYYNSEALQAKRIFKLIGNYNKSDNKKTKITNTKSAEI